MLGVADNCLIPCENEMGSAFVIEVLVVELSCCITF